MQTIPQRGGLRAAHGTVTRRTACNVICSMRYSGRLFLKQASTALKPNETALARQSRLSYRASSGSASVLDRPDMTAVKPAVKYHGVHHVALLCKNLEKSLEFYVGLLGLEVNPDRPHNKLPYRGAWLWIGPEMIHLMELDNPDPTSNRPEHGGRDRHFCIGVSDIKPLVERLKAADISYTMSMSGRPAVFFRDPDMNCLEVAEQETWR